MKYYCCGCYQYWNTDEPHNPYIAAVRDCPSCMAKKGKKWVNVAEFIIDDLTK